MNHLCRLAFVVAALLAPSAALAAESPALSPEAKALLDRIGRWDGVTPAAELAGPYEDPLQSQIPFGRRSYYLAPWRAYMDTWPASTFLQCLGTNFNLHDTREFEPTAQVLAEAGIVSARVEIGWGSFKYDDRTQLNDPKPVALRVQALKKFGIRPLILLNANSGWPCPIKGFHVRLLKDAAEGSREIIIDKTDAVKLGYTGLRGQAYQVAYPLIIKADKDSGRCELSAPLKKAVKAGDLELFTLGLAPFAGTVLEDGTPNPAAKETFDGWMAYVAAICKFAKEALGTEGAADAGFDLEVWNEYTFGSQFLEDRNYYDPPRKFKEVFTYSAHGRTAKGHEAILPMTIDYANDPASKLPGVGVLSGFSNQRPWENGTDMWPGQRGFSRHYYTGIRPFGNFDGNTGILSPETDKSKDFIPLNALGKGDGKPSPKDGNFALPGTFFIPTLIVAMPESLFYGYKTEEMVRDVLPWPDVMKGHGRYTHPGTGRYAQVWQTEFNTDRAPWADEIVKQTGVQRDDPRCLALLHHVAAKTTLRTFVFQSHKGVRTIDMFAAREPDHSLGMIPMAFYEKLKKANYELTDDVRAHVGQQMACLGRVSRLMKTGRPLEIARPLAVARLIEERPRLVFKGDGTPEHPDRFHRDDFACLPFQLDANRYAVAYYVVTRNVVHEWQKGLDALDPARYDMPGQMFQLGLSNIRGEEAKVYAFDPITGHNLPAGILAATPSTITVRVEAVDYPRFLLIEESRPGPLVVAPKLAAADDGSATLTFSTNLRAAAKVSWGPVPDRQEDGSAALPAATTFTQAIPKLPPGSGVKVAVESDGLVARWPIWGHDTAGQPWK